MEARSKWMVGVLLFALAGSLIVSQLTQADVSAGKGPTARESAQIERGRYLMKIAGCNDCHTPGYANTAGMVPEEQWLTGSKLGWEGPWGTTYAINLRLYAQKISEEQWLAIAKNLQARPPMPWFALRDMTDDDRLALYRFLRHLGPAGKEAPAYLPPGQVAAGPRVAFSK